MIIDEMHGMVRSFYLVRHGQAVGNFNRILMGRTQDLPLTELGVTQARAVGQRLFRSLQRTLGDGDPLIVSSPMQRARRTAEIIREEFNDMTGKRIPIHVQDGLTERDFGPEFEGRPIEEVFAHELWNKRNVDSWDHPLPGGESLRTVASRAMNCVDHLLLALQERPADRHLILVSHGDTVLALLQAALHLDSSMFARQRIENCSLSVMHRKQDGWWPESINDTGHLAGLL